MIVARHEVPGGVRKIAPSQRGRLNGSRLRLNAFDRPSRTGALCIAPQALRAWL